MTSHSELPTSEFRVPTSQQPLRLLVVEDSPRDAEIVVREIRRGGFDVTWKRVETEAEMRAALDAEPWEAIIADYRMPYFDGLAALRVLQEKELDIPFIIVSGRIGEETAVAAMKAGAHDYLMKGNLARLAPALDRELRDAASRRDRHQAEAALKASELRYRRLFEAAKDGILILDTETGMVVDVNPFLIELLGYSREALLGRKVWELGSFKDLVANQDHFAELQQKGYIRYEDKPLKTSDGRRVEVEFVSNVYRVNDHKVIQCNIRDISQRKRAEEESRSARAFLDSIINTIADPVFVKDDKRRFVLVNDALCAIVGRPREGLLGEDGDDMFPEDQVAVFQKMDAGVLDTGDENVNEESLSNLSSGEVRTIVTRKTRYIDPAGKRFLVGVIRDFTERKKTEEALKTSEQRFRTAAESLMDVIYESDIKEKVDWHGDIDSMTGYPPGEFPRTIGAWAAIVHPEDMDRVMAALEGHLKGLAPYIVEYRVGRRDGEWRWWSARGTALRDDRGEPYKLIGSVTDITERKLAEETLRESRELLEAVLNAMPVRVFWKDKNLVYLGCNAAFARDAGFEKPEDLIGRDDHSMGWREQAELYRADDRAVIESGEGRLLFEEDQTTPSGERIHLLTSKLPLRDADGAIIGVLGTYYDITELKRAEEALKHSEAQLLQAQKMESVGRLAGGVAHDFNNQLQVIFGYTTFAQKHVDPDEPLYADLEEIRKAAQRSADLTRQLLAFARKQTIAPEVLDLNVTIESMLKMLRRLIGEAIDLAWLPGKNLWPVKVDPAQIDQLLANLCVNARDAIGGVGKVTIETGTAEFDEISCSERAGCGPGEYVVLAVSDDGCGMDKETLGRLFEPFFTTKGVGKGTGLGLAVVHGIVTQSKGFVSVQSEPGKGTTFRIYLPRHEGEAVDAWKEKAKEVPKGRGETVLVVEDELSILRLARRMLESLGYTVLTAGTPGEARRLAEQHAGEIHLLMTDVVMPEMTGRDLAERIGQTRPGLRCLYMSGYTADVIAPFGVLEEGVQFMQKPFALRDLAVKVRDALEG